MMTSLEEKIKKHFVSIAINKDPVKSESLFAGRNLPSFVKDFVSKRFSTAAGEINSAKLTTFLDEVIPQKPEFIKDKLGRGVEITLLARFIIYIDLVNGIRRFSIPDLGIKLNEGVIPAYVYNEHRGDLVDGEKWGIIKLCVLPDDDGKKNHIEMMAFKPFKPYISVDFDFYAQVRKEFTTIEWIDFILSSMEYNPDTFDSLTQKIEFLTRLLIL